MVKNRTLKTGGHQIGERKNSGERKKNLVKSWNYSAGGDASFKRGHLPDLGEEKNRFNANPREGLEE